MTAPDDVRAALARLSAPAPHLRWRVTDLDDPLAVDELECATLAADPEALAAAVAASAGGRGSEDPQVLASLWWQAYAYRVAGTALACWLVTGVAPDVRAETTAVGIARSRPSSIVYRATATPDIADRATATPDAADRASATPDVADRATATPDVADRATTTPDIAARATTTPDIAARATTTPDAAARATTTPEAADRATTTPDPARPTAAAAGTLGSPPRSSPVRARGNDSRSGVLEAMASGPRTPLPRESAGASHCLATPRGPGGGRDLATLVERLFAGHLDRVAAALVARHRLGRGLVWGNVAAACASAAGSVRTAAEPGWRDRLDAFLAAAPHDLASFGAWSGADTRPAPPTDDALARPTDPADIDPSDDPPSYRRTTCCLWWKTSMAGGALCADCSLTRSPIETSPA